MTCDLGRQINHIRKAVGGLPEQHFLCKLSMRYSPGGHHGKANRLLLKEGNAEDKGEPDASYAIFGGPSEDGVSAKGLRKKEGVRNDPLLSCQASETEKTSITCPCLSLPRQWRSSCIG